MRSTQTKPTTPEPAGPSKRPGVVVRLLVTVVAMVLATGLTLVLGPTARADANPFDGITSLITGSDGACKPPTIPDHAGSGVPGVVDDQSASKTPVTFYGKDGWSGLRWTVCDLNKAFVGLPTAESTEVSFDTMVGNAGLGVGTFLGAVITQMQQWALDPGELLKPLDQFIGKVTDAIVAATWTPYAAAVIVLAAIGVLFNALRGETRAAAKTVGSVLLALVAIAWVTTPVAGQAGAEHAASLFDQATTKINGDVMASLTPYTGQQGNSTDEIVGATMQDRLLFRFWSLGALGTDKAAETYGRDLYQASTVPWSEVSNYNADKKRNAYNALTQKIKGQDPGAYDALRGVSKGRAGYGALAALDMTLVAIPRLPLVVGQVAGLVVLRLLIMLAPILALLGVVPATRRIAWSAVKWGLSALASVIILGVLADLHTLAVGAAATNLNSLGTLTALLALLAFAFVAVTTALLRRGIRAGRELARETADNVTDAPGRLAGDAKKAVTAIPDPLATTYNAGRELGGIVEDNLLSDPLAPYRESPTHSPYEFRSALMPPPLERNSRDSGAGQSASDSTSTDAPWGDPYYQSSGDLAARRWAENDEIEADRYAAASRRSGSGTSGGDYSTAGHSYSTGYAYPAGDAYSGDAYSASDSGDAYSASDSGDAYSASDSGDAYSAGPRLRVVGRDDDGDLDDGYRADPEVDRYGGRSGRSRDDNAGLIVLQRPERPDRPEDLPDNRDGKAAAAAGRFQDVQGDRMDGQERQGSSSVPGSYIVYDQYDLGDGYFHPPDSEVETVRAHRVEYPAWDVAFAHEVGQERRRARGEEPLSPGEFDEGDLPSEELDSEGRLLPRIWRPPADEFDRRMVAP